MRLDMAQLRRLVVGSIREMLSEAKKKGGTKKEPIPNWTEKAELRRRDRAVRGTGYSHSNSSDFSQPLGADNLYRRQGAANFGNYTAEGRDPRLMAIVKMIVAEELGPARRGR